VTKGTCGTCQKTMSKGAMTRHLGACGRAELLGVSVALARASAHQHAHTTRARPDLFGPARTLAG